MDRDEILHQYFETSMSRDLFALICGDLIGFGAARSVFIHALDTTCVVKFEHSSQWFQNVIEWETWHIVKRGKHEKWFAPCMSISPCGMILVQRRTTPLEHKDYPRKLPVYLTDWKYSNYGKLDGKFVCHDYGFPNLLGNGLLPGSLKVNWRDTQ